MRHALTAFMCIVYVNGMLHICDVMNALSCFAMAWNNNQIHIYANAMVI